MEEKNVALCILGVIAIIAVVGLVLMIQAEKTGDVFRSKYLSKTATAKKYSPVSTKTTEASKIYSKQPQPAKPTYPKYYIPPPTPSKPIYQKQIPQQENKVQ
jgi:hypothetical protein